MAEPNDSVSSSSRARKVLMGTCGWSDVTLLKCGKFYPASVRSAEDRLRHYSTHFPCVEVDTSTYAIPSAMSITGWLHCVPKGFLFHFKAFGLFCSKSCPINALPLQIRSKVPMPCKGQDYINLETLSESLQDELWKIFNARLHIAHHAGSLGVVVFQYHLTFRPTKENLAHVEWCRRNLDSDFSMAVEFRCRDWFTGQNMMSTLSWLQKIGLALVAADELQHETFQKDRHQSGLPHGQKRVILPVAWTATQPDFIYIRVHRREGTQRLLTEMELSVWENRLKAGLPPNLKGPVYFMWGTDWEDQPIINAKSLVMKLGETSYDWKLAQREFAQKKCLDMYFRSKVDKLDANEHSSGMLERSFFHVETQERSVAEMIEENDREWRLNQRNLQNLDEPPSKSAVVKSNLGKSIARFASIPNKHSVTSISSSVLGGKGKPNKMGKQKNVVASRGTLPSITTYFKK